MATATEQETVVCAFCKGRGTDPFDQLSALSTCGACDGTGTKSVSTPHTSCAFCRGTGSYKTFRCLICGGAGVVPVYRRRDTDLSGMRGDGVRGLEWIALSLLPGPRSGSRGESRARRSSAEEIEMMIKTAHDLRSSLRGSAFRRATFDGRTLDLRRIMTMRERTDDRRPCRGQSDCRSAVLERLHS